MEDLFSEFREISFKEWKNKANFDLKGEDFNNTLNWHTLEGINIPAYFSADNNSKKLQHTRTSDNKINIAKAYIFRNDKRSINIFRIFINDKFDTVKLFIPKDFSISEIIKFKGLQAKNIQFAFEIFSEKHFNDLVELSNSLSPNRKIFLNLDFISQLSTNGNWIKNEKDDFELLKNVNNLPENIIPFSIDTVGYQNSGANIVQQLSYAMSTAVEYTEILGSDFFNKVQYNFALGSNFFLEIAKISTFDYLINLVKEKYDISSENIICCESTNRNKTIYDAHNNLLRSSTEALTAMLSNVDTFVSFTYDSTYNSANKTSSRLGYNQLLILAEEAHVNNVYNITEGSYYIDFVKHELAEKSLEIFKLIESGGGILKQLKEGIIQRKINESSRKEQQLFDSGELKIIGANFQINPNENMDNLIRKYPFMKIKHQKTIFNKIYPKRLSEEMEKERLKKEK